MTTFLNNCKDLHSSRHTQDTTVALSFSTRRWNRWYYASRHFTQYFFPGFIYNIFLLSSTVMGAVWSKIYRLGLSHAIDRCVICKLQLLLLRWLEERVARLGLSTSLLLTLGQTIRITTSTATQLLSPLSHACRWTRWRPFMWSRYAFNRELRSPERQTTLWDYTSFVFCLLKRSKRFGKAWFTYLLRLGELMRLSIKAVFTVHYNWHTMKFVILVYFN